ncbi:hypothetical protein ACVC7V_19085 [Hydrogenophaga sp. A37]|uniref:hypothetical protein n=1 Tax=Hydrogenophaga sp. A37 TaxID=1945864 RepID=UPI0011799DEA|nr:hypothetical protein [Hydrogenophaga sp. A37]
METVENQDFFRCDVRIDSKRFFRCRFFECRFLFHGEGGFSINQCELDENCFLAVHDDIYTIIEMLRRLPEHGATELFSIISAYIQGQSSYRDYTNEIKQRATANLLLRGKLFTTIGVIRSCRDFPHIVSTRDYVEHIHKKIDLNETANHRETCCIRDGGKYVYLQEEWMIKTWTDGGKLPIKPSSTYKSEERAQQMTPDENLILNSNISLQDASRAGCDFEGNISLVSFERNRYSSGKPVPDIYIRELRHENGLVLCFANSFSNAIAARFNRKFCVRIDNIEALKTTIDKQLGAQGISSDCNYTIDHNRSHFLKHIDDAWQDEFRIFWPTLKEERTVEIPPGSASAVVISEFKNAALDELKRISSMYAGQLAEIDRKGVHLRPVVDLSKNDKT